MVIGGPSPLFDRVVLLADRSRRSGLQVSTGELIDACHALEHLDLMDRTALRAGLRATMVKEPLAAAQFDRAFAVVFRADEPDGLTGDGRTPDALAPTREDPPDDRHRAGPAPKGWPTPSSRAGAGDQDELRSSPRSRRPPQRHRPRGLAALLSHRVLRAVT
jgi:uncharacterized protein with von Willebrand factor type A (vWA) domain